ncbi:hypothetical protein TIFTF001_027985 [Ficus carica]|uniref:Uncharacterized protein n=1 Tax=Ficus carica TaxID=3494 RepID=A0AA88DQ64_FICCA|nr:hypothetical protein TIFTF001_027985 [Ficus carica]
MHMQYDEEVDHGEDEPVIVVSPVKSKEIGMERGHHRYDRVVITVMTVTPVTSSGHRYDHPVITVMTGTLVHVMTGTLVHGIGRGNNRYDRPVITVMTVTLVHGIW